MADKTKKPNTPTDAAAQLAAFIAQRGVTKCKPATDFSAQATPLHRMRRQHERSLTASREASELKVTDEQNAEQAAEAARERRYLELQGVRD